jgi:hypothetical protein
MKIRQVGADLFHAGERADMTKIIVAFRNFANAPKNDTHIADSHNKPYYYRERVVHVSAVPAILRQRIQNIQN